MTDPQFGLMAIALLFVLIAIRMPLAVALTGVPFVGIWYLISWNAAIGSLKIIPYNFAANWHLSSVPMFLLMGYLAYHTGITKGLFRAARMWLSRLPAGLAIASIMGASGFSAVTGSSVACAAAMGKIAVPEMLRSNYSPSLATGTVAAAGTIGALIPPSILFIIYGIIAQVPVGDLFIGGAVAGMLTALSYIAVVVLWAKFDPSAAPKVEEHFPLSDMLSSLLEVLPVVLLAVLVFGGLFAGLFTPTEAGAVGALLCLLIALFQGKRSWDSFRRSVVESFSTSAAIFAIAIGANLLTRFVALSGADDYISDVLVGVTTNTALLMLMIVALYLVLGMFLDPLGAMLLTLPILLPIVQEQQLSLLWFGIILGKLLEVGMITPPVGLNVFVLKSVVSKDIAIGTIFKGVVWFLLADVVVITALIVFPDLVLYLPSLTD